LKAEGGFSHNRHALAIVEELEQRYPEFPGLNLSLEVLEGQATRIDKAQGELRPLLEAQVVEAADSVAYDTHDADDALELRLLTLGELLELPLWSEAARRVRRRYGALGDKELKRAVLHELIDWQVGDLVERAARRLSAGDLQSVSDVRRAEAIVGVNPELAELKRQLEKFLYDRVYRHPEVLRLRSQAQTMLAEMFAGYVARSELLPASFQQRAGRVGLRRSVGDYLAGMTDRFAQHEYGRLFAR
jgi:dGTPase